MQRPEYDDNYDYGQYETRRTYSIRGFGPDGIGVSGGGSTSHPFSATEMKHLGMAVFILSLAFAILLSGVAVNQDLFNFAVFFGISLIIVLTGFGLHEMAHKFIAQKYGHWAEFRYSEFGLLISLFSSIVGFLIFIPGAVYITGSVTKEENGKISAGGPAVNIVMAVIFWGVLFAGAFTGIYIIVLIGFLGAWINTIIAGFNMIPIHPLDGSKIWKWNIGIYIGMIVIIVGLIAMRFILI